MDIMNYMPPPFYDNDIQKEKSAFKFLDLLIPLYPELVEFDHTEIIRQYIIESKIKNEREIIEVQDLIVNLLIDEGFAVKPYGANLLLKLTPEGRKLKRCEKLKGYYNMREKWHERNPLKFQFLLAILTLITSIISGGLLYKFQLPPQPDNLKPTEVTKRLQEVNDKVDSLKKSLLDPKKVSDSVKH
jgi:hypothetical protein